MRQGVTITDGVGLLVKAFHRRKHNESNISFLVQQSTEIDIQKKNYNRNAFNYLLQDIEVAEPISTHQSRELTDTKQPYYFTARVNLRSLYSAAATQTSKHEKLIRDLHCYLLISRKIDGIDGISSFKLTSNATAISLFEPTNGQFLSSSFGVSAYFIQDCDMSTNCAIINHINLHINDLETAVSTATGDFNEDFNEDFDTRTNA